MSRAHTWGELQSMTDAELIEEHDHHAKTAPDYMATIRDELRHRELARQTSTIRRLTWCMASLTVTITFATIANVILWVLK